MRWVRIDTKCHPVSRGRTFCGIELATARSVSIASPTMHDRCAACDEAWRGAGRRSKPQVNKPRDRTVYRPRFTYDDWEAAE
jgi:hypothetical protein